MGGAIAGAPSRIPALDGMRAIAVLSVFIFHCTVIADLEPQTLHPADRVWRHLTFLNGLGPLMFFALSGFLITNILLKTREQAHYFRRFYARRALRILPLYYAVLIFSLIVLPLTPGFLGWLQPHTGGVLPENIQAVAAGKIDNFAGRIGNTAWTYWVLLQNWAIAASGTFRHGILDVTWSLAVEEQFYLFWPALVLFFSRRALVRICLGMFVFALLFRAYLVFVAHANPIAAYVLTPARLGAPALGCLVALIWTDEALMRRLRVPAIFLAAGMAPFVWILNAVEIRMGWDFEGEYGVRGGPLGRTVGDAVVALGLFGFLICCIHAPRTSIFSRLMSCAPLRAVAACSYGIFLFHLPIRAVIRDLIFGPGLKGQPKFLFFKIGDSQLLAQMLFYVVAFVPTFVLAWLSWHLFEKHFVNIKRRMVARIAIEAPPRSPQPEPARP